MSKTKNNAIDPLTVMDEFGTDALRFTLLVGSTPGNDMNISVRKIEGNRNFANKVWNVGRFVIGSLKFAPLQAVNAPEWTLADSWIWARKRQLVREVESLFQSHQYGEAGRQIYDFLWGDFADWYLEISKVQMENGGDRAYYTAYTLTKVLDAILRLLHPFTPFVTEALWGFLRETCMDLFPDFAPNDGWEDALIVAKWPKEALPEDWENVKVADFRMIQEIVKAIRNIRSENKVEPHRKIGAIIIPGEKLEILRGQESIICALSGINPDLLKVTDKLVEDPESVIPLVVNGIEIYLPLSGLKDQAADLARLSRELNETRTQIERLETLLNSPFAQKAPVKVVEKEREKLSSYQETALKLKNQLKHSDH